jgi:hypothetical protein
MPHDSPSPPPNSRCPTECRLSYSTRPWHCVVSLKYSYDSRGQALGKPTIVQFGPEISEKSEVEDRIRRAQRAILSPGVNVEEFLNDDNYDARQTSLTFSRNTIELTISGPDLADLSFVDLPGRIFQKERFTVILMLANRLDCDCRSGWERK